MKTQYTCRSFWIEHKQNTMGNTGGESSLQGVVCKLEERECVMGPKKKKKAQRWACSFKAQRILCGLALEAVTHWCPQMSHFICFQKLKTANHSQVPKRCSNVQQSYQQFRVWQNHIYIKNELLGVKDVCKFAGKHTQTQILYAVHTHILCFTTQCSSDSKGRLRSYWKPCCHP